MRKFLLLCKAFRKYMPVISALFFLSTALGWSAGYQEEKLLDTNSYSLDELKRKTDEHKIEIQVLEDQIKDLKADSDWMILKINQIQDSGRVVQPTLKTALRHKEDKIKELTKTKKRLESLVKYYSAIEKSKQDGTFESIVDKKIATLESTPEKSEKPEKKEPVIQAKETPPKPDKKALQKNLPFVTDNPKEITSVSSSELQAAIDKTGLRDWVEIVGSGTCLRLETTLPILFPTGSAVIAGEYKPFFRKLADLLKPYDVKILISGFTDTVPIHNKKYPSNFELGANRATNVIHLLVAYGLKPSIFKIDSTGEYRFAAKKPSTQNAFERRVEITVIFAG
jgi:chemotaxis protein MotB